jgi:hypothetical protein
MNIRSAAGSVGRNLGSFAIAWLLFGIGIRAGNFFTPTIQNVFGLLGGGIGLWIAIRFRATIASMLITGFVLMFAIEFAFHEIFGYHMVQSAPTHFAILAASILGLLLGALAMPRLVTLRSTPS